MRSSMSSLVVASILGIGIGYYTFSQPLRVRGLGSRCTLACHYWHQQEL